MAAQSGDAATWHGMGEQPWWGEHLPAVAAWFGEQPCVVVEGVQGGTV